MHVRWRILNSSVRRLRMKSARVTEKLVANIVASVILFSSAVRSLSIVLVSARSKSKFYIICYLIFNLATSELAKTCKAVECLLLESSLMAKKERR